MRELTVVGGAVRSAPEQNALPVAVRTTTRTAASVAAPVRPVGQLVEELRRERIAVVGGVERERADRPLAHAMDQLCRHRCAV